MLDLIALYLVDIHNIPLINIAEEIALAEKLEESKSAEKKLAENKCKNKTQIHDLLRQIQEGRAAKEKLICSNYGLVITTAKKYISMGVPLSELIQEGNIGLIRAAEKFDFRKGNKFSSYAIWWIRESITRYINNKGRTIRIPHSVLYQYRRIKKTKDLFMMNLGREPSIKETADDQGLSQERVVKISEAYNPCVSLDFYEKLNGRSTCLEEIIPDRKCDLPEDIITERHLREKMEQAFNSLSPREALILRLHYGWIDGNNYSLVEIGNRMGLTKQRVHRLKVRGLSKMKIQLSALDR
jgi:RNA polymerase primary sigma factor